MKEEVLSFELIDAAPVKQTMLLDADLVSANWHVFRPLFEALEDADPVLFLPEDILPLMRRGLIQLWAANNAYSVFAVALTTIVTYPRWQTCNIVWTSGTGVLKALGLLESIEHWALMNNCKEMQVTGRCGWIRALAPYGYRMRGMQLVKPLGMPTEH